MKFIPLLLCVFAITTSLPNYAHSIESDDISDNLKLLEYITKIQDLNKELSKLEKKQQEDYKTQKTYVQPVHGKISSKETTIRTKRAEQDKLWKEHIKPQRLLINKLRTELKNLKAEIHKKEWGKRKASADKIIEKLKKEEKDASKALEEVNKQYLPLISKHGALLKDIEITPKTPEQQNILNKKLNEKKQFDALEIEHKKHSKKFNDVRIKMKDARNWIVGFHESIRTPEILSLEKRIKTEKQKTEILRNQSKEISAKIKELSKEIKNLSHLLQLSKNTSDRKLTERMNELTTEISILQHDSKKYAPEEIKIRIAISSTSAIQGAATIFKDKYHSLPGDMKNATKMLTNCTLENCGNGNGDGIIKDLDSANKKETDLFWVHLIKSGLIYDTPYNNGRNWGASHPSSPFGGGYRIFDDSSNKTPHPYKFTMYLTNILNGSPSNDNGLLLTANQAHLIDKALDDGLPFKGAVKAIGDKECIQEPTQPSDKTQVYFPYKYKLPETSQEKNKKCFSLVFYW